MPLPSDSYWIEDQQSGDNAVNNVDHAVPAGQQPVLQYLYAEASDGGHDPWTLERPVGTVVLQGYTPVYIDFGLEGFKVPGAAGDDVRLAVGAAGAGIFTRAFLVGVDKHQG